MIVDSHWSTNPLSYSLQIYILCCCCLVPGRCFQLGIHFIIGCLAGLSDLGGNLWGGNFNLALYLSLFKTPGCRGRLPWANLPKQKEPPHWGDIGWGRFLLRQFDLYPLAFDLNYKLCDNILALLLGNTKSIFLNDKSFGKPCLKYLSLTRLPGDSTRLYSPILW